MDAERFEQIAELFEGARPLAGEERRVFLNERCSGDVQLRDEVLKLLAHHDETRGLFEQSVVKGWSGVSSSVITPPETVDLPDRIGKYQIVERLGEGGFGVVYRAQQDRPRRDVALKVLRPGLHSAQTLKRFEFEGETLGRLRHPNIAAIYESGSERVAGQTIAFLAMELVKGLPLTQHATRHSLSTRRRLELFARICDAVHYAHQHGVIHRDLKPENILVEEAPPTHEVSSPTPAAAGASAPAPGASPKILDFGVARVTDSDVQAVTMQTGLGQLVGTLAYMSPEQLSGDQAQIDTRSDVYSLGVVLYELLTGSLPWNIRTASIPDAVEALRTADIARISRSSPVLKGDLQTIVLTALAREPARRYQSVAELGQDVRRYLAGEAISARRDRWYVFIKTLRRHRIAISVSALFIALVMAAAVVLGVMLRKQTQLLSDVTAAKAKADQRFDEVRRLAHTFMFDMHDQIARLPGSTAARELLVATALDYLNRLRAEAGDDPALLAELGEGYLRIGHVQGSPGHPNLGNAAGALESYEEAKVIFAGLLAASPDEPEVNRLSAAAELAIVDALQQLGRSGEALELARQTGDRLSTLVEQHPDDLALEREYGQALLKTGAGAARLGQVEEATKAQEQALAIARKLAAETSPGPDAQRDLSLALLHMGDRMGDVNEPQRALDYYEESRDVRQRVLDHDPVNIVDRRFLGVVWTRIGNTQGNPRQRRPHLGQVDAAAESYARGLVVFKELWEKDPNDVRAIRDLCIAYEKLGDIESVRNRHHAALEAYENMLDLNYAFAERDPENAMARNDLVTSEARVALALAMVGRREQAESMMDRALASARRMHESDPGMAEYEYHIGWVSNRYGELYETLATRFADDEAQVSRDWQRAAEWFEKGRDRYQSLKDRGLWQSSDDRSFEGSVEGLARSRAEVAKRRQ